MQSPRSSVAAAIEGPQPAAVVESAALRRPMDLRGAVEAFAACACCSASATAARCEACGAALTAGEFRIESLLAQGAHGRVYKARAPDGSLVALKELVFALAPDAQAVDAFERESKLLAALEHPDIPRFVSAFREGSGADLRLYLAQEFIAGESLEARIRRRRLDEAEARGLARQVLAILRHLHGKARILHRDVKPANVIVRPDGRIALVDLGAARLREQGATHGATMVGTFGYAPMEQLGGTADERSDLYGLGATLVHAVTGIPPAELLTPSLSIDYARHATLSPGFHAFLAALIAPQRELRPSGIEAALSLLKTTSVAQRRDARFGAIAPRRTWQQSARTIAFTVFLVVAASLLAAVATDGFWNQSWSRACDPGNGFFADDFLRAVT